MKGSRDPFMIAVGNDDVIVPLLMLDGGLDVLRFADRAGDFDLVLSGVILDRGLLSAWARMHRLPSDSNLG